MERINQKINEIALDFFQGNNVKFAARMGTSEANIRNYRNKVVPKIDFLVKLHEELDISFEWLLTDKSDQKGKNSYHLPDRDSEKGISEVVQLQIVSKDEDLQPIPVIDIKVAAGDGILNPDYISSMEVISVPKRMLKRNHTYFWVRNKGESMAPGIQDGALILIRLLERSEWGNISKEPVCVIVHNGKAVLKRIKNRLSNKGFLIAMSDNPDKSQFPDFTIEEEDINTLWYAEANLGFRFPNIHTTYYSRLQNIEDKIEELTRTLSVKGFIK